MIDVFISLIATIAIPIVSLYIDRKIHNTPFYRERLEKLYSPLLLVLQNHLFNYEETNDVKMSIEKANNILNENLPLADGGTFEVFMN